MGEGAEVFRLVGGGGGAAVMGLGAGGEGDCKLAGGDAEGTEVQGGYWWPVRVIQVDASGDNITVEWVGFEGQKQTQVAVTTVDDGKDTTSPPLRKITSGGGSGDFEGDYAGDDEWQEMLATLESGGGSSLLATGRKVEVRISMKSVFDSWQEAAGVHDDLAQGGEKMYGVFIGERVEPPDGAPEDQEGSVWCSLQIAGADGEETSVVVQIDSGRCKPLE